MAIIADVYSLLSSKALNIVCKRCYLENFNTLTLLPHCHYLLLNFVVCLLF